MSYLDRPRRVWWRKAMFQIHLWAGVVLCLYMIVIGVTGSILVFESQIEHLAYPHLWRASATASEAQPVAFPSVIHAVQSAWPGYQITAAYPPDKPGDNFEVFIHQGKKNLYVFVDAHSGQIDGTIDPDHLWLIWIIDLHFRLLGGRTGAVLNGLGAIFLLILCLTGAVVWWAGLKHWWRGLVVSLRKSWRRINYDLHSAVGFWVLLVMSMWAVSGIYFIWPAQVDSLVNRLSSTATASPPQFTVPRHSQNDWVSLETMIREAQLISPGAQFGGAFFPGQRNGALTLLMARGPQRGFTQMDYIYFDPVTGRQLAVWRRGVTNTWGSKFLFWLGPLHFGYDFGLTVQMLWAVLGFSLPVLSITGVLMYWNRSLSKRWRALSVSPKGKSCDAESDRIMIHKKFGDK